MTQDVTAYKRKTGYQISDSGIYGELTNVEPDPRYKPVNPDEVPISVILCGQNFMDIPTRNDRLFPAVEPVLERLKPYFDLQSTNDFPKDSPDYPVEAYAQNSRITIVYDPDPERQYEMICAGKTFKDERHQTVFNGSAILTTKVPTRNGMKTFEFLLLNEEKKALAEAIGENIGLVDAPKNYKDTLQRFAEAYS